MLFAVQTVCPVLELAAQELTTFGVAMEVAGPGGSTGTTCIPVVPADQEPSGT